MKAQAGKNEARHTDVMQKLAPKDQIATLDARLQRIESLLQTIQRDLEGKDYSGRFNQLQDTLRSSHLSLTENLQSHFMTGKFFISVPSSFCGLAMSWKLTSAKPSPLPPLAWASSFSWSLPSRLSSLQPT